MTNVTSRLKVGARSALQGVSVMETDHSLDEDQVRLSRCLIAELMTMLGPRHPQVQLVGRLTRGTREDHGVDEIRSGLKTRARRPLRAACCASAAATVRLPLSRAYESLSEFSGISFSLSTIRQSSGSDVALIFRIMLLRCTFTVVSVMPISPAICLFSRPAAT